MPASTRDLDFHSMNRRTRTVALVGRYLQCWALMETEIDDAISKALKLTGIQTYLLGPNLPYHKKIHILWVLVNLSVLTETAKENYIEVIKRMLGYSSDRNIIAHDLFSSSGTNNGVQFIVVKTQKGQVQAPPYDWSIAKFQETFDNLAECAAQIHALTGTLSVIDQNLAKLLAIVTAPSPPIEGLFEIGSLGLLTTQPPTDRTSETNPASDQTDVQNPSSQPE
jgi:hypothetical protein